ncbi:MAG: FAD-binding oxidoreductase [Chloroflexi bacterium]|nr:FAD-binding oxidoreductase [Chloroflexota bacterium]
MKTTDVLIIGAGVIGCAIGFELAKKGYKVVQVDKNPDSGFGSTSSSCSIVRAHYSTFQGVAMAYEGFFYWKDWPNYVGDHDERGLAKYMNCGSILLKTKGHRYDKVLALYREIGVEHEEWDLDTLKKRMPLYDHKAFYPPTRPESEEFWNEPTEKIAGAIFTPGSGYVNDPKLATHNYQRAAEAHGAQYIFNKKIVEIRRDADKVIGVTLDDGEKIDAPVVVNVAGPHSFVINRMAGVEEGMKIKTKALRHEVHHVFSPQGFDFEHNGFHTSDGDNGIYFRPEIANSILVGSEDPECDPKTWIEDPDNFNREITEAQWKAQVYRLAKRIPDLNLDNKRRGVVDLYDVSDDWIPIYDKSDLKGFYMAIGTSGNQFKNAPPVGYVMSELIHRVEQGEDHDKTPVQIKAVYTGLMLDMAFYSRLREINRESSFSVNG